MLRQALFDRPGNPDLLAWLAVLARQRGGNSGPSALLLTSLLEQTDVNFSLGELWGVLHAFDEQDIDTAFAALAPLFQRHLLAATRDRMIELLTSPDPFVPANPVAMLCRTMRAVIALRTVAAGASQAEVDVMAEMLSQQAASQQPDEDSAEDEDATVVQQIYRIPSLDSAAVLGQSWRALDDDRLVAVMPAFIAQIRADRLLSTRTDIDRRMTALERLLVQVAAVRRGEQLAPVDPLATACLQALRGTLAAAAD
ncbi:hypothetical protein [Piscinibacter sakaiensis]|uniref:hypothetical protein n=1 Tax=Piscinibacter sakaiensis TaxID=1547922 RepID=UPI003AAE7E39